MPYFGPFTFGARIIMVHCTVKLNTDLKSLEYVDISRTLNFSFISIFSKVMTD